jgi:hypothetical protein
MDPSTRGITHRIVYEVVWTVVWSFVGEAISDIVGRSPCRTVRRVVWTSIPRRVSPATRTTTRSNAPSVPGRIIRSAISRTTPEIAEGVAQQVICGITRSVVRPTAAGRRWGVPGGPPRAGPGRPPAAPGDRSLFSLQRFRPVIPRSIWSVARKFSRAAARRQKTADRIQGRGGMKPAPADLRGCRRTS